MVFIRDFVRKKDRVVLIYWGTDLFGIAAEIKAMEEKKHQRDL
jgi:hypothetical protein